MRTADFVLCKMCLIGSSKEDSLHLFLEKQCSDSVWDAEGSESGRKPENSNDCTGMGTH